MSHTRVIARNGFWTLLDSAVSVASTLICSVAVARVMGPDKLGYYNYALFIANITGMLAAFGVPVATRKYAAEYLGKGQPDVARAIIRMTFRFQLIMAAAVFVAGTVIVFTVVSPEHRVYAFLAVLSMVPSLVLAVATAAVTATEDVSWNVRASLVGTLINGGGVALALVLRWDLPGLTAALFCSRLVDALLRFRYVRILYARMPGGRAASLPPELRQRMIRFCWLSTALLALDVIVWDRFEILFLERFSEIRQVAFYSLAFNIVQNMLLLPRVLAWSTDATLLVQQGRAPETVGRIAVTAMRFMALFAVPAAFGLAALAGPLLQTLYGARYVPAIQVLTVLALFSVGKALLLPAQHLLVATENQGFLLRWGLVLAAVNVGVNLYLVPTHGALGAALAKGSVQIVASVGLWVFVAARFRVAMPILLLSKLMTIGALMFAGVRLLVAPLTPVAGVAVGLPAGIFLVVILLRLFRCMDAADRERLMAIQRMFPRTLRAPYGAIVRFVMT